MEILLKILKKRKIMARWKAEAGASWVRAQGQPEIHSDNLSQKTKAERKRETGSPIIPFKGTPSMI
jgi:hypothetical protein